MKLIVKIFTGPPLWIYPLFGYLFSMAIQALKPRVVFLPRLFVIPCIFTSMKLPFFKTATSLELIAYFSFMATGIFTAYLSLSNFKIQAVPQPRWSAIFQGSSRMLILVTTVFVIQYSFGALMGIRPDIATQYLLQKYCIDGLISGFFFGQAITFVHKSLHSSTHSI